MSLQINTYHGTFNRSWRIGGISAIKYIVIHYTATLASALNNCIFFANGNRKASADYFVDDSGIWEYNYPKDGYYTWAVGDGGGKYGITNANSISIEVVNAGGAFSAKEQELLQKLVTYLMEMYNVPAGNVVRHYDASRKACPAYYASNHAAWTQLRTKITAKGDDFMSALTDAQQKELYAMVKATNTEVMRTDDPTGRKKNMKDHDHLKWIAVEVQNIKTICQHCEEMLEYIEGEVNKNGQA